MLSAILPLSASAQVVVGSVVEEGTLQPLPGAFVQLYDASGARHAAVLTGPDGGFVLRAPRPGRYRMVAELIGYASGRTGYVDLPADATIQQVIEVAVQAVSLGEITAEVGDRCRRRPGSGPVTARLWDEARKALEVARWSEAQQALRFQIVEHVRELDARTLEVLEQSESGRWGLYGDSPYRSIPAEDLARHGYVRQRGDGTWDYFAPDADVLLSESFLDTHCFRVVPASPGGAGLVGLGFEPVPERELPDLDGVLWLDEATAELRRLDFTYTGSTFREGPWHPPGGRVEFERLATGMWIVRRWHIRMPLQAMERRGDGRRTLELVRLVQQGAEVSRVRTRSGQSLAEATGATLYGRVTGPGGEPLPGATVEVAAARRVTKAGADGGYRLAGLPAGRWSVSVSHPSLRMVGLSATVDSVELEAGRATRLPLSVAPTPERALEVCAESGWRADDAPPVLLYGRVNAPGRDPAPGNVVRLRLGSRERRLVPDSAGVYRVCLEPGRGPAWLAAVSAREMLRPLDELAPVRIELPEPGFVRVDLEVADPSERPGSPLQPREARLRR
jgi:hypothetical protein